MLKKSEIFSDSSSNHSNPEITTPRKERNTENSQLINDSALIFNH